MAEDTTRFDLLAELIATSPHNLVSRRDRALVGSVHIPECRAVARGSWWAPGQRWLDLGTGGGLPGLVLALEHPEVDWVLLDATRKKVEAVRAFAERLGISNAAVIWGRAEALGLEPGHHGGYDGVISRAVAHLGVLAAWARSFLRPGGLLIAVKGKTAAAELEEAASILRGLKFALREVWAFPDASRSTTAIVLEAGGQWAALNGPHGQS